MDFNLRKIPHLFQYSTTLLLITTSSVLCYITTDIIGYKAVALILLVVVSLLAMLFDILPVLLAALLSALIWNFFFIPPTFTFHITDGEDALLFLLYFLIASVNAVLTVKIRIAEKKARDKEEKENTIKLYNTLLNSLSHELRTPIAAILGAVEILKEKNVNISEEMKNELLSEIDIAGHRLNRQVENLLNMSRLETGMLKLNLDWCDLNELMYSVIQKITLQTKTHVIQFPENENLPLAKIDAGLVRQSIYNILYNAVQYTPKGSVIKIAIVFKDEKGIISICDNGKGFPEDEIPFLFDKFYRLPHTQSGGTGLGLSITKGFVEAHGGTIKAENAPLGGAVFTISIPMETTFINNLKNE